MPADASVRIEGTPVRGVGLDGRTRCAHYDGDRDVVALALPCCDTFYACHACHDAVADHPARPWPASETDAEAALCGACGVRIALATYFERLAGPAACPACGAGFNPGCLTHRDRYVEG